MTAQLFAAVGAVLSAVIVGALGYIVHLAKKAGQKQTEAEVEQQKATNTAKAASIVAERRDPDDTVDRLSRGTF